MLRITSQACTRVARARVAPPCVRTILTSSTSKAWWPCCCVRVHRCSLRRWLRGPPEWSATPLLHVQRFLASSARRTRTRVLLRTAARLDGAHRDATRARCARVAITSAPTRESAACSSNDRGTEAGYCRPPCRTLSALSRGQHRFAHTRLYVTHAVITACAPPFLSSAAVGGTASTVLTVPYRTCSWPRP